MCGIMPCLEGGKVQLPQPRCSGCPAPPAICFLLQPPHSKTSQRGKCRSGSASRSVLPHRSGQQVLGLVPTALQMYEEPPIPHNLWLCLALLTPATLPPPSLETCRAEKHFPPRCWISPPAVALRPCGSVTGFPSRASTAFLTQSVACGKGVGREEGVGCVCVCVGGELLLLQFHASICILSLCMASCFFTPLLFETTSCKGGRGGG